MSIADLIVSTPNKPWCNLTINKLNTISDVSINGTLNMNENALTNVSSINGNPLPPINITLNPVNIIYPSPGSNIFTTWSSVVSHASQININEILNIYFDDSMVSPAPIDTSTDFLGRATLNSSENSTSVNHAIINDGVTISNLKSINGSLVVECNSVTTQNLAFNNNGILTLNNSAVLECTTTSSIPCILLNDTKLTVNLNSGSSLQNSLNSANHIVDATNGASLVLNLIQNSLNSNNTLAGDSKSSLNINYDSFISATPAQSAFLGTVTLSPDSHSSFVYYNDNITPTYGSSTVQGALDSIKGGLSVNNNLSAVGDVFFGGRLIQTTGGTGPNLMQMYTDSSGDVYWYNGSSGLNQIAYITSSDFKLYDNLDMQNTTAINANAVNYSNFLATGTSFVTGDAAFVSDVSITGTLNTAGITCSSLSSSGNIAGTSGSFSNNLVVGGTFGVTGATTLSGNVSGTSGSFTNNLLIGGTLGVTGAVTLASTLGVNSTSNLSNVNAANVVFAGTLGVTGATTLSGNLVVGGTLGVTGAVTLASTLGVTSTSNLSNVNAANVVCSGTLGVTGATTLSGHFSGTSGSFTNNLVVGGTLGVTGTTTLSNLNAANVVCSGTLGVTGALSVASSVNLGQGAVTQLTSNATGVTINSSSGKITMFAALATVTSASFTVTNSSVVSGSSILLTAGVAGQNSLDSGVTLTCFANNITTGSFSVQVYNTSVTSATHVAVISFLVC